MSWLFFHSSHEIPWRLSPVGRGWHMGTRLPASITVTWALREVAPQPPGHGSGQSSTVLTLQACPRGCGGGVCTHVLHHLSTPHWAITLHLKSDSNTVRWWKVKVQVIQLCMTLCNPMDCSLPDSSVLGILQVRILKWVTISFSRWSSWPRDRTLVSCIAGRFFTLWTTRDLRSDSNTVRRWIEPNHWFRLPFTWEQEAQLKRVL